LRWRLAERNGEEQAGRAFARRRPQGIRHAGHAWDARGGTGSHGRCWMGYFVARDRNRHHGRNAWRGRDGRELRRAGVRRRLAGGPGQFQVGLYCSCRMELFTWVGPCLPFSNIQRIFQFFNYLPNVFKLENMKHHLTEVQFF
jgi:hypothetical protein